MQGSSLDPPVRSSITQTAESVSTDQDKCTNASRVGSLRWRLLVVMLVLVMVPLVIMAYQGYHCARMAIMDSVRDHLHIILHSRVRQLDAWVVNRKSEIGNLADAVRVADAGSGSARQIIQNFRRHNSCYRSLALYGEAGKCLFKTGRPYGLPGQAPTNSRIRVQPLEAVNAALLVTVDGDWILRLVASLSNGDESAGAGYLVAETDMSKELKTFFANREGLYQGGKIYLIHPKNKVVLGAPGAGGSQNGAWFKSGLQVNWGLVWISTLTSVLLRRQKSKSEPVPNSRSRLS